MKAPWNVIYGFYIPKICLKCCQAEPHTASCFLFIWSYKNRQNSCEHGTGNRPRIGEPSSINILNPAICLYNRTTRQRGSPLELLVAMEAPSLCRGQEHIKIGLKLSLSKIQTNKRTRNLRSLTSGNPAPWGPTFIPPCAGPPWHYWTPCL